MQILNHNAGNRKVSSEVYCSLVPRYLFRHFFFSSGERKKYYKHQKKAEKRPDKYLSLIIDGMDQSKTHLPIGSRNQRYG